jgi:type II secretory pathway pseudopilin PulG
VPLLTGKAPQQGFTYLWLLLAVAMGSAAATALSEMWLTQAQRSKEEEMIFRGLQIAAALNSYAKVTLKGNPCAPVEIVELLEDRRGLVTQRHLRKLYTDREWKSLLRLRYATVAKG